MTSSPIKIFIRALAPFRLNYVLGSRPRPSSRTFPSAFNVPLDCSGRLEFWQPCAGRNGNTRLPEVQRGDRGPDSTGLPGLPSTSTIRNNKWIVCGPMRGVPHLPSQTRPVSLCLSNPSAFLTSTAVNAHVRTRRTLMDGTKTSCFLLPAPCFLPLSPRSHCMTALATQTSPGSQWGSFEPAQNAAAQGWHGRAGQQNRHADTDARTRRQTTHAVRTSHSWGTPPRFTCCVHSPFEYDLVKQARHLLRRLSMPHSLTPDHGSMPFP